MKSNTSIYVIMGAAALMMTVEATNLLKKKDKVTRTQAETEQVASTSDKGWEIAKAKEDPLRVWDEIMETGQTPNQTTTNGTEQRPSRNNVEYPPVISVSANKDTIVWNNGLYVKVDDIIPPSQDTIIVGGRKFIEIKD